MSRSGGHRYRRNFFRKEDGAITIEFVVTFPIILAALAFSYEFGRLFIAHHTAVNNVRSAVRYLSRSELSATQVTAAEQIMMTGQPSGGTSPSWMHNPNPQITPSQDTFTDTNFRNNGQIVRVRFDLEYQVFLFNFIGDTRLTIPIAIVEDMRHIGD